MNADGKAGAVCSVHHNSLGCAERLKILFLSSDRFPPFRVDVKILFGRELSGRGHKIDWILQSEAPCNRSYLTRFGRNCIFAGASDRGHRLLNRIRNNFYDLFNDLRLFKLISRGRYDLVLVKDKYIASVLALLAAKLFKTKFVFWLSYPFPESKLYRAMTRTAPRCRHLYYLRGFAYKALQFKIIMPFADHIFVQSEKMKEDVTANGIDPLKITPVPMGVDLEEIDRSLIGDETIKKAGEKSVCYLGTMIMVRRLDFLIRVFYNVLKDIPEARLYMVGGGGVKDDLMLLKTEAVRLGIEEAIVFTGQLPREAALDMVRNATVCVSPFYPTFILNSTSPTKLIEYMALGRPVVANDHPEQRLVLEKSGAGICVSYNEGAFAEAIIELLNNPEKADEMGRKGRLYVKKERTYKVIGDRVEKQLLKVAQRR